MTSHLEPVSAPPPMVCQGCGCTDERACQGGCFWVFPAACSSCVLATIEAAAELLDDSGRAHLVGRLRALAAELEDNAPLAAGAVRVWQPGDSLAVPAKLFRDLVWLQAAYASQLNSYDGGARRPVHVPADLLPGLTDRETRIRSEGDPI